MSKPSTNQKKWIESGYALFGDIGTMALNVEKLSTIMGLKRSSFYHYFGTVDQYEEALLEHHVARYQKIGEIIRDYTEFDQLFSREVFEHQDALMFQRQLMINQSVERYKHCSDKARLHTEPKTFELWSVFTNKEEASEEDWEMFRVVRDFYFVNHGQSNLAHDPKEVITKLHSYWNRTKK